MSILSIDEECQLLAKGDVDDTILRQLTVRFIRGQDEIAVYRDKGTGRILSAWETYKTFGSKIFKEILEYGTAVLSVTSTEPAATLKKQREALNISQEELAKKASIPLEDIKKIESSQYECDFRTIEKLCNIMNIDDYTISYKKYENSKNKLAYRLKKTFEGGDIQKEDILRMTECGWIADKHALLQTWLNEEKSICPTKDNNYGTSDYPAYRVGYDLAHKTRNLLNIKPGEPISSIRNLCKNINIPYILTELSPAIAGATVATKNSRCIIANIKGKNENPLIRRIAIAHELAHFLWDSDKDLKNINVSLYEDLDNIYNNDVRFIEQRANAFAVEFLMPSAYIEKRKTTEPLTDYIRKIMLKYGTSFTSTKYHLCINKKITEAELLSLDRDNASKVPTCASDEWKAQEDFTADYFPIRSIPINKRGSFAYLVCKALQEKLITEDSAASFLECSKEDIKQQAENILNLF